MAAAAAPSADPHRDQTEEPEALTQVKRWLLEGHTPEPEGPHELQGEHRQHPWWQVMCLTGVDYFSTLGYQPGIAALAAGALAPVATLVLVLVTLFGALPIYRRVAAASPHGEGSLAMLRTLLNWWKGKLFVLCLLGFAATDFIITITLSAADATAHVVENPFTPHLLQGHRVAITLFLIFVLGAIFLKGFKEAIGIAVVLVAAYLALNLVVITVSLLHLGQNPGVVGNWERALFEQHGSPLGMLAAALLVFPKLALGLSGFETGVAVMPLVRGDAGDTPEAPAGRIRNARRLLLTAALLMSAFLVTSSFVTIVLIPAEEFQPGGKASGRALAYLAHTYLGEGFGTAYDVSTILILWFAGASAMAGLLNLVPRYLPRYGMAPDWARATRPLVLVFTTVALVVTVVFRADVNAQGGAYATGVLVLMTSAAVAVLLAVRGSGRRPLVIAFTAIALVFAYTTVMNVIERPDGVKIASLFIATIIVTSLVSRALRSTELRVTNVVWDEAAARLLEEASRGGAMRIVPNHPDERDWREYALKAKEEREDHGIPPTARLLFFEVYVTDASEFAPTLRVTGHEIEHGGERYCVLRAESASVANAIAAFLLHVRDRTGLIPHAYFEWTEGNPLLYVLRFLVFGDGDIAPVTREILRRAEPDPERRPVIHVG